MGLASTYRDKRGATRRLVRWERCVALLYLVALPASLADSRVWVPLEQDGIHDPASPAIKVLQQPREALMPLPADSAGNLVRWVEAIEKGVIAPRTNILPETKVRLRETDIILNRNGSMLPIRFPHRAHTLWLDCSNCHEDLFKSQIGANKFSMAAILEGEQCGVCHGAVAFPLTECDRCHNTPRSALKDAAKP